MFSKTAAAESVLPKTVQVFKILGAYRSTLLHNISMPITMSIIIGTIYYMVIIPKRNNCTLESAL